MSASGATSPISRARSSVRVWDAASGQALLTLEGHQGRVFSVAYSPDGRQVLSSGEDRKVVLWEIASGRELSVARVGEGAAFGLARGEGQKWLALSTWERRLWIYDVSGAGLRPVATYRTAARRSYGLSDLSVRPLNTPPQGIQVIPPGRIQPGDIGDSARQVRLVIAEPLTILTVRAEADAVVEDGLQSVVFPAA